VDTFIEADSDGAKNQLNPTDIQTNKKENRIMENNINSDSGNNKLTHLAFEEYFAGDWRKHFQEKDIHCG
jgi:hypothetical protein